MSGSILTVGKERRFFIFPKPLLALSAHENSLLALVGIRAIRVKNESGRISSCGQVSRNFRVQTRSSSSFIVGSFILLISLSARCYFQILVG